MATVESSSLSACFRWIYGQYWKVSKALSAILLRTLNHTLDDWKPDPLDPNLMNLCLVSEGILSDL